MFFVYRRRLIIRTTNCALICMVSRELVLLLNREQHINEVTLLAIDLRRWIALVFLDELIEQVIPHLAHLVGLGAH